MKWFKHDTDASIDAKLQTLLLDYGAKGYGLYWYCVELIAQGVSENNITFELEHDSRIIARNLNLTAQETKDMMEEMLNLGLFSVSSNQKLACYALAKRLDQSMTSNDKMRKLIADIKQNHDPVMTQSRVSHDKVMQEEKRREEIRKDKNRVDKSKKFSPPTLEEIQTYIQEKNYNIDAQKFYDYFTEGNWHDSKGNPVKNWKQKVITWHSQTSTQTNTPRNKSLDEKNEEFLNSKFDGDVVDCEVEL